MDGGSEPDFDGVLLDLLNSVPLDVPLQKPDVQTLKGRTPWMLLPHPGPVWRRGQAHSVSSSAVGFARGDFSTSELTILI